MNKTLHFSIVIQAPTARVWDTMLGREGYEAWTAAFCAGSTFDGAWSEGAPIRFLAPSGDGMVAVIAENRRHEFVSIRHLGEIHAGVEDTTSDKVRAWAPAYENYAFRPTDGGTELTVDVDTMAGFEHYMNETFPKALTRLKALCEGAAAAA
jgi:hypothetical protein